ncbi:MAG TPA: right-handed parallel beta-helix repeat-containing protein [Methanomassiliicoccales archaeon]
MIVCAFALLLSASGANAAPTYVYQDVSTDTTWTEAGSPYIVNQTVTVPTGVTLTIGANVAVKVDPGQQIIVNGSLMANGQASKMVTFTKNNSVTMWNGITGNENSVVNLNYANINNETQITIHNTGVFTNSKFANSLFSSIYFQIVSKDGTLTVTNCDFTSTSSGVNHIYGVITVSSDANNIKTINVPISITGSYFGPGLTGSGIMISENVVSRDNSAVTLNSNVMINNNQFNTGARSAVVFSHALDSYDNSTSQVNGDTTINTNRFNSGPAVGYADLVTIHDLVSPLMVHNNIASVTGNLQISNNDMRSVQTYGITAYAQVVAYGEKTSSINVPITISRNNITSAGDGILVQRQMNAYEDSTAAISGAVTLDSNKIFNAVNGAYVSTSAIAAASSKASVMINSDLSFTNNVMTTITGRGLYVYDRMTSAGSKASSFTGSVTATRNTVNEDSGTMIEVDRSGFNSVDGSSLSINGGILITNNLATSCRNLVTINISYLSNGKSTITANGDVTVNDNQAVDALNGGITILFAPNAAANGTTMANVNILSTGNTLQVSNSYAMDIERSLTVTGNSTGTVSGTVSLSGNNIVDEHYVAILARNYVNAYDSSKGTVNGDFSVSGNTVLVNDRTAVTVAIGAYAEVKLAKMTTTASYTGNVLVADNSVTVTNLSLLVSPYNGVYVSYYARGFADVAGSNQGDKWANASLGNVQVLRNTVTLNGNNAGGIEFNPDLTSYATHGGSARAQAGTQSIANNHIIGVGNFLDGVKMNIDNLNAASIDGNATVLSGSITFQANSIDLVGNNSRAVNVYNYFTSDIYAYPHTKGLASLKVDGGLNIVGNSISTKGNENFGVYFNNNAQRTYVKVVDLKARALVDFDINVSNNVLDMKGMDNTGITFVNHNQGVGYWDGNVTLKTGVRVAGNNIVLDANTGVGVNTNVLLTFDPLSFNGHASVNAQVSIADNTVSHGQFGIQVTGSGAGVVLVSGNRVTGTYGSAISMEGSNAIIENNVLSENQGNGISLDNCTTSTHIVIGNNTIDHNANDGLYITDSNSVTLYNGVFQDNVAHGINVPSGSQVKWIIDSAASVKDGDVVFFGAIEIMPFGILTVDSVNSFTVGAADNGLTQLIVDLGGSQIVRNSNMYSYSGNGLFLVYGNLQMTSSVVSEWSELFLGNTSTASITSCTIQGNYKNGIFIDGAKPTISSTTIVASGMDGIFVNDGSEPNIKSCIIMQNERGIYARNSNLDNVVDNIFVLNSVAGIYAEGVVGKIHANIFLLDKNEIFLFNCAVTVEDNEIGYARIVDDVAKYSTLLALVLSYVDTSSLTLKDSPSDLMASSILPASLMPMLLDHVGMYAINSDVTAKGNTYGMLSYAVYAENSTISFGDTVKENLIVLQWLNKNLDSRNITIPTFVYNGIYAINSKLTMNGAAIQCRNDAVFLDDSSAVISKSALNASKFDVYSIHNSTTNITSTTMDGMLKIEDIGSMTWLNQFTVIVKNADGKLVAGAPVTICDAHGKLISSGVTGSNGQYQADVTGWTQNVNGRQVVSDPYWVNATVDGKVISQKVDGSQPQTVSAQAQKSTIDTIMLPLLLVIALIVVVVVIMVVTRIRKV